MSASLMALIPLVLLGLVAGLCFVGCVLPVTGLPPSPTPLGPYGDDVKQTSGFVACWPLNDILNSTKAKDISSNHFDGNVVGPVTFGQTSIVTGDMPNGAASTCAKFTGGFVQVGFQGLLNPMSFSVEAWVKPEVPTGQVMMVVASDDLNAFMGYQLHATAENTWAAAVALGPGPNQTFLIAKPDPGSAANVIPGKASYLVATWDGATLQLFVDGKPSVSKTVDKNAMPPLPPFAPAVAPIPFAIGALTSAGSTVAQFPFNGEIQDVAFYNGVLSQGDITDHFNTGMPTSG
jgi:concanavalin A-like lectin/glucanase superfamily protein